MRVLAITNWYPPHHFGGYELSCFDVMVRFVDRGHDVQVLCSDERVPGAATPGPFEARVHRDLRLYHRDGELFRPSRRERLAIERHNQAALRAVLDEFEPDVVSAWHFGALSLGLLTTLAERAIPITYCVCDDWLVYGTKLDAWADLFTGSPWRRTAGRALRPLLGVPTAVPDLGPTGVALFVSDQVRSRAIGAAPWRFDRQTIVYSGIEAGEFAPASDIADAPPGLAGPWRGRLICTGRFDPRKGQATLLEALPQLPGTTATLLGRGGDEERARLERLAADLGVADRAVFGAVDREELAAAYRQADAMVFPSTWPEPFGLTPLEAMACGIPVLATGVGGSAEFLVDSENCLWFEPGDPAALARAVQRLASDEALRARLIAQGLRTAADLTTDHLADAMEPWHTWAAGRFDGPAPADRRLVVQPATGLVLSATIDGSTLHLEGVERSHRGDARAARAGRTDPAQATDQRPPSSSTRLLADPSRLPLRLAGLRPVTRVAVDARHLDPTSLDALLTGLAAVCGPETDVRVRIPSATNIRANRVRARRWWHGDHRPVDLPAGTRSPQELGAWEPPGWVREHVEHLPFGPTRTGRTATAITRLLGRERWWPGVEVRLRRTVPGVPGQESACETAN